MHTTNSPLTNFNPRSLSGATVTGVDLRSVLIISIHAPSRERPVIFVITLFHVLNFNPRSLSGATGMSATAAGSSAFQSTLPLGSDITIFSISLLIAISIHAPSRERPFLVSTVIPFIQISIHAPSRERPGYNLFRSPTLEFQSTLPLGSDRLV